MYLGFNHCIAIPTNYQTVLFQVPNAQIAQFQENSFLTMVETIEETLSDKVYIYRDNMRTLVPGSIGLGVISACS